MKAKKVFKVVGITLASIVGILGVFVAGLAINGSCFNKYQAPKENNKQWMSYIKDDTKVSDIVIPGSHDSGTYHMSWLGGTQYCTIKEQLDSGVRYFDLRVNKTNDDYLIYHDIINGEKFLPILSDIKDFITLNTSETLILDFQHFKGGAEEQVYSYINEYLITNNLAVSKEDSSLTDLEFIDSLTLGSSRGKCILFWGDYHTGSLSDTSKYLFSRNNDKCTIPNMSLNSCYLSDYNKKSSSDYIKEGLPLYYENIRSKITDEGHKGIFVLQGQLTDGVLIFGPYSKEKGHDKNMTSYISDLETSTDDRLSLTNVIIRDFIDETKANNILRLNHTKGLVKSEAETIFTSTYLN